MNMTIAYVLFIFTSAIVISFFIRYKTISTNSLFFLFCCSIFLYELLLIITSWWKIPNHIIANMNTVIYYPLTMFVLFKIWESLKGKAKTITILKFTFVGIILIGWLIENFAVNNISYYNSKLPTIISLVVVAVAIYLINVMLFVKNNSILKDSDGLLLIGILIRSFSGGLVLIFFNYRMQYNQDFYAKLVLLVNISNIISDIFFIFSIICLPKKRKYIWPF